MSTLSKNRELRIAAVVDYPVGEDADFLHDFCFSIDRFVDYLLVYKATVEQVESLTEHLHYTQALHCTGLKTSSNLKQLCDEYGLAWLMLLRPGMRLAWRKNIDLVKTLEKSPAHHRVRVYDILGSCRWEWLLAPISKVQLTEDCEQWLAVQSDLAKDSSMIHAMHIVEYGKPDWQRQTAASMIVAQQNEPSIEATLSIARAFELLGDPSTALGWYQQVKQSSDFSLADQWYAEFRSIELAINQHGLDENSFARCSQLFEFFPERVEPLIRMAEYRRLAGDVTAALNLLDVAQNIPNPGDEGYFFEAYYHSAVYAELAECHASIPNHSKVLELSSKALNQHTQPPNAERQKELRDAAYGHLSPVLPSNQTRRNHFVIIIPFYNVKEFLQKCADSIAMQSYQDYEVIFIDDVSDDGGLSEIDLQGLTRYRIIKNTQKYDGTGNQVRVMSQHPEPHDIAVLLDGDDSLAHADVLKYLNQLYNHSGCWLSYGQHRRTGDGGLGDTRPILHSEQIADLFSGNRFVFPIHLRTNRIGLLQQIEQQSPNFECLRDSEGNIMSYSGDIACTRAMMMLAGKDRVRYVPEVLYNYNTGNPSSHHHLAPQKQTANAARVAQMPELNRINSYFKVEERVKEQNVDQISRQTKLLVICLDGANPKLISQLIDQGKLPNISKYFQHSSELISPPGFSNDSFWRSIYSGKQPGEHFMCYRHVPRSDSYRFDSAHIDQWLGGVDCFWGEAGLNGHQIAILNAPECKPHSLANVTLLSDWCVHAAFWSAQSDPPELMNAINQFTEIDPVLNDNLDNFEFVSQTSAIAFQESVYARQKAKSAVYQRLLNRGEWSLFLCGFDAQHDISHNLWHFHDVNHPRYQALAGGDPVEAVYQAVDKSIGELVAVSEESQIALICGLGSKANVSLNSILGEILLRIETYYYHEVDVELEQNPVTDESLPSERRFYCLASNPTAGAVRLNLVGREPQGKVLQSDYDSVCERLTTDLLALRCAKTKNPVVAKIVKITEQYSGPYLDRLPDLMVVWSADAMNGVIVSDTIGEVEFKPSPFNVLDYRTGDHDESAVIYVNDKFAEKANLPEVLASHQLAEVLNKLVQNDD